MDFLDSLDEKFIKGIIVLLFAFVIVYSAKSTVNNTTTVFSFSTDNNIPIYSVDTGENRFISITFDSAWGDEDLDTILEILNKHNCPATFFVTGDWAMSYPDAIKK